MWFESAVARYYSQSLLAQPDRLLPSHSGCCMNICTQQADGRRNNRARRIEFYPPTGVRFIALSTLSSREQTEPELRARGRSIRASPG
jgi:hypothetical protein